jgi:hypothetical protein
MIIFLLVSPRTAAEQGEAVGKGVLIGQCGLGFQGERWTVEGAFRRSGKHLRVPAHQWAVAMGVAQCGSSPVPIATCVSREKQRGRGKVGADRQGPRVSDTRRGSGWRVEMG